MNKNTKIIIGIVVILIAVWGIWYGVNKQPKEQGVIKIGFIGPLTGDATSFGETEKNAVEMALAKINAIGGINSRKLEVIYEDGKCGGKDAATAIQKLINIDRVKIVLGGTCSAETLGAAPIAEQNKVILFSAFASNPSITESGDYIFRNSISDLQGGKDGAAMIKEKKIAILTENTDYSMGIREVFKEEFTNLGGEILIDEIYVPGEKDFRTYLTKVKGKNPEAIFVNPGTSSSAGGLIIKQARELNIEVPIYGNFLLGVKDALEAAGESANGVIFFDAPGFNSNNPRAVSFLNDYKLKYGDPSSEYEAGARYDSVFIINNALKECGENSDCIKDFLYKMDWYEGTIGKYKFDNKGDIIGLKYAIKEIINGKVVERK